MSSDYEKLKKLYDRIDELIVMDVHDNIFETAMITWNTECKRFLTNKYGNDSIEYNNYQMIMQYASNGKSKDNYKNRMLLQERISSIIKPNFENLLEDLKENKTMISNDTKNVFIVHGHADDLKYQISDLLRTIKLNPIILHKKTSSSRTIIEKIEKYGCEASAAVVLFTPDDFGNVKSEEEKNPRARQNVVFEAGYFMGLLGRDRVLLVVSDKSIELPGDLSGVVYSETSESDIAKELKAMGLDVDLNDLM